MLRWLAGAVSQKRSWHGWLVIIRRFVTLVNPFPENFPQFFRKFLAVFSALRREQASRCLYHNIYSITLSF